MTEQENKKRVRGPRGLIVTLLVLLAIFLIPFAFVAVTVFLAPPVYEQTFVGELGEKYDRLCELDSPKLVVVGGSSVAFGLDSELVERELDMSVVNFGLYANLGTKLMLDLSRTGVGEGDIIVVAPEINSQTLSLYFNAQTAMQALDGRADMLAAVDSENYEALVGASWGFAVDKTGYLLGGELPENTGAYSKECFNKYGDNTFARPYNVMTDVEKTISLDFEYIPDDGVTTEYEEFIDYLNAYVDYCTEKGATVYFSFSPMNEAALDDSVTDEVIGAFYENLSSSLHCRVISNINECIMDEGYFFDSEFHLNDSGVTVRTVRLIDDIKREIGNTELTMKAEGLPKPSGYAPIDFAQGAEENLYFELELYETKAGHQVYYIIGLNDEGKKQISLRVPNNTDGCPIVGIRAGAFDGSELRTLVLGDNITDIKSLAFSGASHLRSVYVQVADPNKISVPNMMNEEGLATEGAPSDMKIYVPSESLGNYSTDYFWGDYAKYLEGYENED